jgi:hypothetical protein
LASIDASETARSPPHLQGGLRYCTAAWPIDDLIKQYRAARRRRHAFARLTCISRSAAGARRIRIERLAQPGFVFCSAIVRGDTIGAQPSARRHQCNIRSREALLRLVSASLSSQSTDRRPALTALRAPSTPCSRRAPPLERIPLALIPLAMGSRSARVLQLEALKINSWEFAIQLFEDDYGAFIGGMGGTAAAFKS